MHKFCYTPGMSVQDFDDAKFSTFTGIQRRKYIKIVKYIIQH